MVKLQANSSTCPCLKSLLPAWKHHWGLLLPLWPFLPQVLCNRAMTCLWASMWLPSTRNVAKRKLLALTSAGPASSADPERCGAFPADGGGLQHGLHVLVLSSILSVLQPLGLALAGGGAAGELARLREENGFVVLTQNSTENRPESRTWIARRKVSSWARFGVQLFPKEPENCCLSPSTCPLSRNKLETGWWQGADTEENQMH